MNSRLSRRFLECVKVHHHHVDRGDAMFSNGSNMLGIFAAVENSAVDFGMKRLNAAIEHFGESSEIGNILHRDAGVTQKPGGSSSRDQFDVEGGELTGELDESGLVGDAENGALDAGRHARPQMK